MKGPYKESSSIFIGAAAFPVPSKLVERIKAKEFIEMAELLPDCMGTSPKSPNRESEFARQKVKHRPISNIIEWMQCFNIHLSVVCRTCPGRIPDLLAYQMLIIEAIMVYKGNAWLGYDLCFRQAGAAMSHKQWSKTDTDLRDLAFTGMARQTR